MVGSQKLGSLTNFNLLIRQTIDAKALQTIQSDNIFLWMDTPIGYTCVCSKLEPKEDKRSRRKEGSLVKEQKPKQKIGQILL